MTRAARRWDTPCCGSTRRGGASCWTTCASPGRGGAALLGYDTALFGVHFKTICWADPLPEETELLRRHQEIYLSQFGRERYDRYIQIPLAPGEAPRPVSDWTEE